MASAKPLYSILYRHNSVLGSKPFYKRLTSWRFSENSRPCMFYQNRLQHTQDKAKESKVSGKKNEEIKLTKELKVEQAQKLTGAQRLKKAITEYGSTVIVFHIVISLASLGTCYILVSNGLSVTEIFAKIGLEEWASKSSIATNASTFAVAYAVHKVFAPVRISITLGSVPFIVRYLRSRGFLKK